MASQEFDIAFLIPCFPVSHAKPTSPGETGIDECVRCKEDVWFPTKHAALKDKGWSAMCIACVKALANGA